MRTKLQELATEVNFMKLRLRGAKSAIEDAHRLTHRLSHAPYPIKTEGIAQMIRNLEVFYKRAKARIKEEQHGNRS